MSDTAQKIAEIREALEFNEEWWVNVVEGEPICQDEIDEVKGLIEANRFFLSELDQKDKENRRFREERDKLIEVLRWYAQRNNVNTVSLMLSDKGQRARDILKEIGVTVDV